MIYFWSDTHFFHTNIIEYCHRPYTSVDDMTEGLIERWNKVVTDRDTIYHLGDFGFGKGLSVIFDRLQGHKHLVVGNHDEKNPVTLKLPWESITLLRKIKDNKMSAVACHYPLETWAGVMNGRIHVHGHSHGLLKRKIPWRFDVGVDVRPEPVSLEQLMAEAWHQDFEPQDHHGDI